MNINSQMKFLSEDNVKLHLSHLSDLRLKWSVFKKSIPELEGKTLRHIIGMKNRHLAKEELLPLINSIKSHELHFSSFSEQPNVCKEIREHYSSEAAFLYELYTKAKNTSSGFLYVSLDRGGRPEAVCTDGHSLPPLSDPPRLAFDLFSSISLH